MFDDAFETWHEASGRIAFGLLAGIALVGISWFGVLALGQTSCSPTHEARYELGVLERIVTYHYFDVDPSRLPEHLAPLEARYESVDSDDLDDPWGRDYVYRKEGTRQFALVSSGPDEQLGTDDDLARHVDLEKDDT
jgi:hypothetical protein